MTLTELGSLGELIGSVAVVVSIVYLATQIRQNTRSVRASTLHHSTVEGNSLVRCLVTPEASRIVLKGSRGYEDLPPEEKFQYRILMQSIFSFQEDNFLQFEERLLRPDVWEARSRGLREWLANPGVREWWMSDRHIFTDRFREVVDATLAA